MNSSTKTQPNSSEIEPIEPVRLIPRDIFYGTKDFILFLPLIFITCIPIDTPISKDIQDNYTYLKTTKKGNYYVKNNVFMMIENFHMKLPSFMRRLSRVIISCNAMSPFISTNPHMCYDNFELSFDINEGKCGRVIHEFNMERLTKNYLIDRPLKKEYIIDNMLLSIHSKKKRVMSDNTIDFGDMKLCYEVNTLINAIKNDDFLDNLCKKGVIKKTDDERYFID
jgi:hypothetical protein